MLATFALPILAAGDIAALAYDLIVILIAGFIAGLVCRKIGISMLIGYLVIGTLIGDSVLGLVSSGNVELQHLAEAGVLLLLFTIGLELSLEELVRLRRHLLVGGATQMSLVLLPVTAVLLLVSWMGGESVDWRAALLVGIALSFSSTVLVFQALNELGEAATRHGKRAIAILLFQDVAVVPTLLVIPLLSGEGTTGWGGYVRLFVVSVAAVPTVLTLRWAVRRFVVPMLAEMRSPTLVVLFTLAVLAAVTYVTELVGLPAALGAFAAGLTLSGNRLTAQVDALVLSFREVFAAVFFISLGMLLEIDIVLASPLVTLLGLVLILALKTGAAAVALRLTNLTQRAAVGMGLGLSQVGEFALVVVITGVEAGVVSNASKQQVLFLAVATLILTPILLKRGLKLTDRRAEPEEHGEEAGQIDKGRVVIAGMGLVGRGVAERMRMAGMSLCLVDQSPVNLHRFAADGVQTIAGDASDPKVLMRAGVGSAKLVVITVPSDEIGTRVLSTVRSLNRDCPVILRCRYRGTATEVQRPNVTTIVEETQTLEQILEHFERLDLHEARH